MQEIQVGIYQETGVMAINHFSVDDLRYLFTRLPKSTKEMLRLAGRDKPELLTMYDLSHSLISNQGSDAAAKIHQVCWGHYWYRQ